MEIDVGVRNLNMERGVRALRKMRTFENKVIRMVRHFWSGIEDGIKLGGKSERPSESMMIGTDVQPRAPQDDVTRGRVP